VAPGASAERTWAGNGDVIYLGRYTAHAVYDSALKKRFLAVLISRAGRLVLFGASRQFLELSKSGNCSSSSPHGARMG
jgi:hypothetical protein